MVTLLQDEHAHLVFTLNFELCALLNCLFFAVGSLSILMVQGRLFVKMSKESVIDCGDRLQGGIIVRKPN